jgi:hypothetical protein
VVVTGAPAPVGSWTDVLQLVYVPLAVAGLVSIPSVRGERVRTIADTAVAAGSLWYLTVALILEPHGVGDGLAPLARLVALGYLLGPPLVIGVLLSLLQGTSGQARSFLVRTAAGMGLLCAAEVCFALAAWTGTTSRAA